jgi:hypothetical protein
MIWRCEQRIVSFSTFPGFILAISLVCLSPGEQTTLFSTFSVFTNLTENLFNAEQSDSIVGCLDGIRALSIMWVIHANRVQTYVDFPLINKRQFREVGLSRFIDCFLIDVIVALANNMAFCNYNFNPDGNQHVFSAKRISVESKHLEAVGSEVRCEVWGG